MRIGDYEIQGEVARGAFGIVYRAHDPALGRDVAIKLLLANSRTGAFELRRFTREARALARLHHPNIVNVLGSGREGEHPYLVMKLAEGETLEDRLVRAGPLPPAEAVGIAIKLARAIDHAHQALILHRDIKPANVIVAYTGEPLLTDFGLAKDLAPSNSDSISVQGRFMGTPGYWPPEQAMGEVHRVGAPSDIYSLGATLYACLTGTPPQPDEGLAEALVAIERRRRIPAPSSVRPGVDPALDRVVLGCLEREPGDRYLSAADLADDLERWLRGEAPRGPGANSRSGARRVGLGQTGSQRWLLPVGFAVLSLGAIGAAAAVALTRPTRADDITARSTATLPAIPSGDSAADQAHNEAERLRRHRVELRTRAQGVARFDPTFVGELEAAIDAGPGAVAHELRRLLRRYCERRGHSVQLLEIPPSGDPGPHRVESLWQRAMALENLDRLPESHAALKGLASTPSSAYSELAKAVLAMRTRRYDLARAHATRAEELGPDLVDPLLLHMVLLLRRSQGEQALRIGERALQLAPDHYLVHYKVARAYMALGRRDKIFRHLEIACRLSGPKPPADLQIWRIKALYNLKRYSPAVAAADALARAHPTHAVDAEVMAGVILLSDKQPTEAKKRWRAGHSRDRQGFLRAVRLHPPPNMRATILGVVGEQE